jgi:hypothetical protein
VICPAGCTPVAGSKIATHELTGSVWAAVLLVAALMSSFDPEVASHEKGIIPWLA